MSDKPREYMTPNVADLLDKWNSRHRVDREVMGAIELAYARGEHNGYRDGFNDGKRGRNPRHQPKGKAALAEKTRSEGAEMKSPRGAEDISWCDSKSKGSN